MDDRREAGRAPATQALAPVVRQFAGSRVERQLLAQVFDWVWQGRGGGGPPEAARDHGESSAPLDGGWMATIAAAEGVWP